MKSKILLFAAAALFICSTSFAQEQGDMRAGIGVVLGTAAGFDDGGHKMGVGITPSFEYVFADAMSGNVSYDFYFKSDLTGGSITYSSFNIDYRYYFMTDDMEVYGLAGLGFVGLKSEVTGAGSVNSNATGLNLGAGANFGLSDSMGINVQVKYCTAQSAIGTDEKANIAINGGLIFKF